MVKICYNNKEMAKILLFLLAGWLVGWLVNYLADVLPATLKLSRPTCLNPDCRQPYAWGRYLFWRRCPACGRGRGWRAYAVQGICLMAALFLGLQPPARLSFAPGLILFGYLLTVAVIDLEHRLILAPLSLFGLALALVLGVLLHGWVDTLIGGVAGFLILYCFYLFGKIFTRLRARRLGVADAEEALGSGDVTLATVLGLLLGWPLIWFALLMAVLAAGLVSLIILGVALARGHYRQQAFNLFIPYAPFFIFSAVLLLYFPQVVRALLPQ